MNLNIEPFTKIDEADKKLTVVTKYFDCDTTIDILNQVQDMKIFYSLGENRVDKIKEKNIPREFVSFIGNIQSRRISEIVEFCSIIQTVTSLKHLLKISEEVKKQGFENIDVFIQVNISNDKTSGIETQDFDNFYKEAQKQENVNIVGISAIGSGTFTENEKKQEFEKLIEIKKKYPKLLISAGTSRDYEIAIEYDIDILRLGSILYEE